MAAADLSQLQKMAEQLQAAGPAVLAGTKDQMLNLQDVVDIQKATCLNASADSTLSTVLKGEGLLMSDPDVDQQLLIFIPFREAVKIRGINISSHDVKEAKVPISGPKLVKLFVNRPNLDFDGAQAAKADQEFTLTAAQLDGREILTNFVKFTNVHNLTIFVDTNQKSSVATVINRLSFVGTPLSGMKVAEIKKVDEDE